MNFQRALITGILLYLSTFVLFAIFRLSSGIDAATYAVPLRWYVVFWVAYIPIILGLAKWYFRKQTSSVKAGLLLGVVLTVVVFIIDGIAILGTLVAGQALDVFYVLYIDWKFVVSIAWIVLLCMYAGWEFDSTYTTAKN